MLTPEDVTTLVTRKVQGPMVTVCRGRAAAVMVSSCAPRVTAEGQGRCKRMLANVGGATLPRWTETETVHCRAEPSSAGSLPVALNGITRSSVLPGGGGHQRVAEHLADASSSAGKNPSVQWGHTSSEQRVVDALLQAHKRVIASESMVSGAEALTSLGAAPLRRGG